MTYTPRRTRKGQVHPRTMGKLLKIWEFIETYRKENGFPPSTLDVVRAGYVSAPSVCQYYFRLMAREGILTRVQGVSRSTKTLPLKKHHKEFLREMPQ